MSPNAAPWSMCACFLTPLALCAALGGCKENRPDEPGPTLRKEDGGRLSADPPISAADRKTLLRLARRSLVAAVSGLEPNALTDELRITPRLKRRQGAFVTLKKAGRLRGCIGTILPHHPLYEAVIRNARNAALHDSRFSPVTLAELDQLEVEISALSIPAPVGGPADIVVGTHGIILARGQAMATFLPHVATEQGWDRDTTLTHLSRKAGLGPTAWRDAETQFQVYTAEVWSERGAH